MKYSILVILLFIIVSCNTDYNKFKAKINSVDDSQLLKEINVKYKEALTDSLNKSNQRLSLTDDFKNSIFIKKILFNKEKDSLYIILIDKSTYSKINFTTKNNTNPKVMCNIYSLYGIAAKRTNDSLNFNIEDFNLYKTFNNCTKVKTSFNKVNSDYLRYVFDAKNDIKELDLQKNSSFNFFNDLYTKYYKNK